MHSPLTFLKCEVMFTNIVDVKIMKHDTHIF
jgi:hypothetical protein